MGIVGCAYAIGLIALAADAREPDRPAETFTVLLTTDDLTGGDERAIREALEQAIERHTILKVRSAENFGDAFEGKWVASCAGDADCIRSHLADTYAWTGSDLILAVSAAAGPSGTRLFGAYLFDTKRGDERVRVMAVEIPSDASASRVLSDRLSELFPDTIWGKVGEVSIAVDQPAQVQLGNGRLCVSPCRYEGLYPGMYSLLVEKRGFETKSRYVDVKAGEETEVYVELDEPLDLPAPNPLIWGALGAATVMTVVAAVALSGDPPAQTGLCARRNNCPEQGTSSLTEEPFFWTTVVFDVAAAGVVTYLLFE